MIKNFLKKIYITKEVSRLVNFIGSPWKGRGAILMYHRILPDEQINEDLNLGLAVSCSNFENQVKMMKSKYKLCSMDEFLSNLKKDKNEFMLTITFDDGYKDNLIHALPILEKYKVPALIYITTRFLKRHVDLWWFELIETIQNKSELRLVSARLHCRHNRWPANQFSKRALSNYSAVEFSVVFPAASSLTNMTHDAFYSIRVMFCQPLPPQSLDL